MVNFQNRRYVIVLLGFLLGLFSLKYIPFAARPGASSGVDFYNLHTYNNCENRHKSYSGEKDTCGDERGMVYPPLMLDAFRWTHGLSFETSLLIWRVIILSWLLLTGLFWLPRRGWKAVALIAIVSLQFSGVYALERGNNDILVLLLWTLAAFLFLRQKLFFSGLVMSCVVALKIYPLMAVGAFGLFLLYRFGIIQTFQKYRSGLFGFCLGLALFFFLHLENNLLYYLQILPEWAAVRPPGDFSQHGLQNKYFGRHGVWIGLLVVVAWVHSLSRCIFNEDNQKLALAFSLAISTYFPGTANDYSLICSLPLILLLIEIGLKQTKMYLFFAVLGATLILHSWYFLLINPFYRIDQIKLPLHVAAYFFLILLLNRLDQNHENLEDRESLNVS